jgi:hypothetical protein
MRQPGWRGQKKPFPRIRRAKFPLQSLPSFKFNKDPDVISGRTEKAEAGLF